MADALLTWPAALALPVRARSAARYSFLRRRGRAAVLPALAPDAAGFAQQYGGAGGGAEAEAEAAGAYARHRAAFLRLDSLAARWRAAHAARAPPPP